MIDVPETQHHQPERGRLTAIGRRTDDGSRCTLLLIHESDGSWSFHGLGAPGVKVSKADTVALVESILKRALTDTQLRDRLRALADRAGG